MFVMAFEIDQVADVRQQGSPFDQLAITRPQSERSSKLLPKRTGNLGDLLRMGQIDAAAFGELLDGGGPRFRRNRLWWPAECRLHHFQKQPIAHAARVDLYHVDVQVAHDPLDD